MSAVQEELVALITQAKADQGMNRTALADRLGWQVAQVARVEDPEAIEAFGFAELLDLLDAVGLDPGEVTDWLAVRYRAERMETKEQTR